MHTPRRRSHAATLIATLVLLPACGESPTEPPGGADPVQSVIAPWTDHDLVLRDVGIRPGATADIHLRVHVNEFLPCRDPSRTALAVHGVNATAATWGRLAEAFFVGPESEQLCLFVAMDQPGHGLSGLPGGVSFGELMVEDYARVLTETLTRLARRGIRPAILVGHSQGTLTIQTAQQMLMEQGTSLRGRYDVQDVVFLGTQGPMQVPAEFAVPTDVLIALIGALVTTTAEKGTFVQGPPDVFRQLWFINRSFLVSSDAPTVEEILANGWNEDVPLFATLQAAGLQGFHPPAVDAGVLGPGSGTALHVIDFADDPWSLNAAAIYAYLTGDEALSGVETLADPDHEAVHLYAITDPDRVRGAIDLPRAAASRSAPHP